MAQAWRDRDFAREWAAGDGMGEFLSMPRKIAAEIVALEGQGPRVVVDVGSGPGAFLEVFLDRFPQARGVWSDASDAMLEQAREALASDVDRVDFRLGDMTDLSAIGIPRGVDVVLTSRAVHHLDPAGIAAFYRDAAAHLAPGGWLVNLDHVGVPEPWDERLRAVRPLFVPHNPTREVEHHHPPHLASIEQHVEGFFAAGIRDVQVPWRAFHTALLMGRKAG